MLPPVWREEPPTLGTDQLRDTVSLRLGWHQDVKGLAIYSLELPPGLALGNNYLLTFALANLSSRCRQWLLKKQCKTMCNICQNPVAFSNYVG